MNSTKILFLNMFKNELKKVAMSKLNTDTFDDTKLTGQKISMEEIESFYSYKLMNDDEKKIVNGILNSMKKDTGGSSNNKMLTKRYDSLIPRSVEANVVE